MTIAEALRQGRARLAAVPLVAADAARDAELLLMHVLQLSRATVLAYPERELAAEQEARYGALIAERLTAKPIQYIIGEQEFYGLRFQVTPDVLIPRPETEHLVAAVLERVPRNVPVDIVDVGTGSGAIAVALAHALPLANVTALDISAAALEVARGNAAAHGIDARIEFLQSDLLSAVLQRRFDAVVSNPPYIATAERETLHAQVREFEPALALFSGETGFEIYERLAPQAALVLKPGGLLAMEIGFGQRGRLVELLRGWRDVECVNDLQGIERVVLARRA